MAERLGKALQKLLQQFESVWYLFLKRSPFRWSFFILQNWCLHELESTGFYFIKYDKENRQLAEMGGDSFVPAYDNCLLYALDVLP